MKVNERLTISTEYPPAFELPQLINYWVHFEVILLRVTDAILILSLQFKKVKCGSLKILAPPPGLAIAGTWEVAAKR